MRDEKRHTSTHNQHEWIAHEPSRGAGAVVEIGWGVARAAGADRNNSTTVRGGERRWWAVIAASSANEHAEKATQPAPWKRSKRHGRLFLLRTHWQPPIKMVC